MSNRIPNRNTSSLRHSIQNVELLPNRGLWFHFAYTASQTFTIDPKEDSYGVERVAIWVNGVNFDLGNVQTTMDVNTTGENGLVDGIAKESGQWYLIWAFTNESNTGTPTFGMTRKPISAFTGISSGTKGLTATLTGMADAFQFVIGARVVVRNDVAPAPLFQYNWGTVASIVSDTSITVDLDSNTNYGTNLTAATNGIIKQWNKFRPNVITTTAATLFENNYRLLGELSTLSTTGIRKIYKVTDTHRLLESQSRIVDVATTFPNALVTSARYVPLWADRLIMRVEGINTAVTGKRGFVQGSTGSIIILRLQLASQRGDETAMIEPKNFVTITYDSTIDQINRITLYHYVVEDGMRL